MNLSQYVYFDFFAIGALIPVLFLAVLAYFFITIRNKSKASLQFAIAFTISIAFYFAYVITSAIYHPLAAYHRWLTAATIIIANLHFAMAVLAFPDDRYPRFTKIYLALGYLISIIITAYFFYQS